MKLRQFFVNDVQSKGIATQYFDLKSPPASMLIGGEKNSLTNEYRQLPIVYSVVNAIGKRVASVPYTYYREGTDTEAGPDAIQALLEKPAYMLDNASFRYLWVVNKELYGQHLMEVSREIQNQAPQWIRPAKDYKPWYENGVFMGWIVDGKKLSADDVIYDRYPNPWNDVLGLSPLEATRIANETEWNARQFNRKFFENDATPGGYISAPDGMTHQQKDYLRHQLIENRKGAQNAHSWLLLEGEQSVNALGSTQRDSQFVEQFKLTLHDVCAAFNVDPSIIGFEDMSKYASAKEARRYMWTDVVIPYLDQIEKVLNGQLLKGYNLELRFDTSKIEALQVNLNETVDVAEKLYNMGVPFNLINERLELGFDEVPGGDEPKPSGAPMLFNEKPPEVKEAIVGPPVKEGPVESKEVRKAINYMLWKAANDEVDSEVSRLNSKVLGYFKAVRRKLQGANKSLGKAITRDDIDGAFEDRELVSIIMEFLTRAGVIGYAQIAGVSMDFENPPQAVLSLVAERAGMIKEVIANAQSEVRGKVQAVVREAIEEGLTEQQTTDRIAEALDGAVDNLESRARTIARTEVHTAHSEGRYRAMEETEPVAKRWVAAPDARDSHLRNEGAGVLAWNETYAGGLRYPMDSGPAEEVINCRCVLVPIYEGEL